MGGQGLFNTVLQAPVLVFRDVLRGGIKKDQCRKMGLEVFHWGFFACAAVLASSLARGYYNIMRLPKQLWSLQNNIAVPCRLFSKFLGTTHVSLPIRMLCST